MLTGTIRVPAENTACGCTVTTFWLLEVRVKNVVLLAGLESIRLSVLPTLFPVMVSVLGENAAVTPTVTSELADRRPTALAVTVTFPSAMPLISGTRLGCVWPTAKSMLAGNNDALLGSLTVRSTSIGTLAGWARVTGN